MKKKEKYVVIFIEENSDYLMKTINDFLHWPDVEIVDIKYQIMAEKPYVEYSALIIYKADSNKYTYD